MLHRREQINQIIFHENNCITFKITLQHFRNIFPTIESYAGIFKNIFQTAVFNFQTASLHYIVLHINV